MHSWRDSAKQDKRQTLHTDHIEKKMFTVISHFYLLFMNLINIAWMTVFLRHFEKAWHQNLQPEGNSSKAATYQPKLSVNCQYDLGIWLIILQFAPVCPIQREVDFLQKWSQKGLRQLSSWITWIMQSWKSIVIYLLGGKKLCLNLYWCNMYGTDPEAFMTTWSTV